MPRKRRELPWLTQHANSTYYACWYDTGTRQTRRLSLGTGEAGEAALRFAAFLTNGGPAKVTPASATGYTVAEALEAYCRKAEGDREAVAAAFLEQAMGELQLTDIDDDVVEMYLARRRSGDIAARTTSKENPRPIIPSDGTLRRELGVLVSAVQHAVRKKKIGKAEAPEIELPDKAPPRAAWLFPDELAKLREAATGRVADFIELAYFTAGRKTSVERLTVFQIDLPHRRIDLRLPGERQTKKRKGVVPIDEELVPTLERLMAEAGTGYLLGHGGSTRKTFEKLARDNGLLNLPAREMRPACKLTPHVLRHSRATHLLQDGMDPYAVADLLCDTVDIMLQVYAHACPSHVKKALDARRTGP